MSLKPVQLDIYIKPAFWQTIYFRSLIFILSGLLLFLWVRRWVLRREAKRFEQAQQKKKLAELELQAIKAQINPHFIYNCLNSIQYFNYKNEHANAQQYLDLFAKLIRLTMQYSQQAVISIAEEREYLTLYLELEQLRFKQKLVYELDVAPELDPQQKIPAMLIQPYVENALKHGLTKRKEQGRIIIRFAKAGEDYICITIEDDGPGLCGYNNVNKSSWGLRLSGTRAETYNELFGLKIKVNFHNKQPGPTGQTGLIVNLNIPTTGYENLQL